MLAEWSMDRPMLFGLASLVLGGLAIVAIAIAAGLAVIWALGRFVCLTVRRTV